MEGDPPGNPSLRDARLQPGLLRRSAHGGDLVGGGLVFPVFHAGARSNQFPVFRLQEGREPIMRRFLRRMYQLTPAGRTASECRNLLRFAAAMLTKPQQFAEWERAGLG